MNSFRYQAVEAGGQSVAGVIEAEDRKAALHLLGQRQLFPSSLEQILAPGAKADSEALPAKAQVHFGHWVRRKDITVFTRGISALLAAGIPIPQALANLADEEDKPPFREILQQVGEAVRKGESFSAALAHHPKLFGNLYTSMIRVGEEAGVLPKVMNDLADLLEHEDEVRGEVVAAVSYPIFVLCFGFVTVTLLLTVVLPRLFTMLEDMLPVLPLPTLILLGISHALRRYWFLILAGLGGAVFFADWFFKSPAGAELWDKFKLKLPFIGPVFQSSAMARFARTLGTLVKSGVSLLPALKIVENTIGNRILAAQIARVAEETRGGDSLAAPLRKLGIFPRSIVQMIDVGEESGRLDEMLLKVAAIEERRMRARTKTLISLLAPILILIVGAMVGFMVIAILLPIFKMSSALH